MFVSSDGRWRLGGLETLAPASEGSLAKDVQALGLMVTEILANCKQGVKSLICLLYTSDAADE